MKRSLIFISLLFFGLLLTSCGAKKLTVNFDLDGGYGNIESLKVKKNRAITKPEDPLKNAYEFEGWFLGDEEFDFEKGTKVDITLVAKWKKDAKPVEFIVVFDLMGGNGEIPDQIVIKDTKVVKPTNPTKDGYDFVGWYYNNREFSFDTIIFKDIILKAKWEPKTPDPTKYIVDFDLNGGTSDPIESQELTLGGRVVRPEDPTREEYNFVGWYDDDKLYDFDTLVNSSFTLVAKWQSKDISLPTNEVTFDTNGGTPESIPTQDVKLGKKATKPADPTKEGHTFLGWYVGDVLFNFSSPIYSETNLVAKWEEVVTTAFTVTFKYSDESTEDVIMEVESGNTVDKPADPVREGYIFKGWLRGPIYFDFNTPITIDTILVAKWEIIQLTVTFNPYGGMPNDYPPHVIVYGYKTSPPPQPTREGYEFLGWAKNNVIFDFDTPITEDTHLVAKWELISNQTIEVTYDSDGGTPSKVILEIAKGSHVPKPDEPTKENHIFLGWMYDGEFYQFDTPEYDDIYLTAIWQEIEYIWVEYYWEEDEGSIVTLEFEKGTIPEYRDVMFTNPGYRFVGWSKNGVPYDFTTPLYENTILIPIWEMIVQAYIGDTPYIDANDAAQDLNKYQTLHLTEEYDGGALYIDVDYVTITRKEGHEVIVRNPIYVSSDRVIIEDLEFTENARIYVTNSISSLNFYDNKVYDITLPSYTFSPSRRPTNIAGFIHAYNKTDLTLDGFTAYRNEFTNINGTAILLGTQFVKGVIVIYDNIFSNITQSALRIDADGFDGDLRIQKNEFYNHQYNAIFVNGFGFEVGTHNPDTITITDNLFDHVSTYKMDIGGSSQGSTAIIFDDFTHEKEVSVHMYRNEFRNNYNAIYLDNIYSENKPNYFVKNNLFYMTEKYYLYQKRVANETEYAEANFKENTFVTEDGQTVMQDNIDTLAPKIHNNNNYFPVMADDSIMFDINLGLNVHIYVDSSLNKSPGAVITALDKEFIFGETAFKTLQDALDVVTPAKAIYIHEDTVINHDIEITVDGLYIFSKNYKYSYDDSRFSDDTARISGKVTIKADQVSLSGLRFIGDASIEFEPTNGKSIEEFRFVNNTVFNYFGSKNAYDGFIETTDVNNYTYKNFYISGNLFNSAAKLTPIYLRNIKNVYINNNNFKGLQENNNSAIVLTASNNPGTPKVTGNVYIYRNNFDDYGYDFITVKNYNGLNLKIAHNLFTYYYRAILEIGPTIIEDNYKPSTFAFHQNTTYNSRGESRVIETYGNHGPETKIYVHNNRFIDVSFVYFRNFAEIDFDARFNTYEEEIYVYQFHKVTLYSGDRYRFGYQDYIHS